MDSILINPPVSSPLHPQLNLPLLAGYLRKNGFSTRVIDANILFFNEVLKSEEACPNLAECRENPLKILGYYTELEGYLKSCFKEYPGVRLGLRSLGMAYDRTDFGEVKKAVGDEKANPFIAFFSDLIDRDIVPQSPSMVGISITFQDQIIPAFTLASLIRSKLPRTTVVLGGQMITRCHESLMENTCLRDLYDYLILWEGETPLLELHEHVLRGKAVSFTNIIRSGYGEPEIDRKKTALKAKDIPFSDYSDIDFDRYVFPDMLVPFQTTRGCYGSCAFCAIPAGANTYLKRSAEDVISDLIRIQTETQEKYGKKARFFKFMEDTSSPELLYRIAVEIEKQGLEIFWETFARLETAFTEDGFLNQLYRGGCRKIHWGLESSDPSILKAMNKKTDTSTTDRVLTLSGEAGILNFCFVLVGFPGETDDMREHLTAYIVGQPHIHTLTVATFDLTRKSPMEQNFSEDNPYGLSCEPARDFQVRLPYWVHGGNWKETIVPKAHKIMLDIIRQRPDIGFMTLFPDQVRMMFCEMFGNTWARDFSRTIGRETVRDMLVSTENFVEEGALCKDNISRMIPEPFLREQERVNEDLIIIARAIRDRKQYERRRIEQV